MKCRKSLCWLTLALAVCAVAASHAANPSSASAQLKFNFGGNNHGWGGHNHVFGGNNHGWGGHNNGLRGNWLDVNKSQGHWTGGEIRHGQWVPGKTKITPNIGNIIHDITSASRNNRDNSHTHTFQPHDYTPQTQTPTFHQPPPTNTVVRSPSKPAAPKNVITTKKVPPKNGNPMDGLNLRDGVTVADAKQAAEVANEGGIIDRDLDAKLQKLNPDMHADWQEIMRNGSDPDDIAAFRKEWESELNPGGLLSKELQYRESLAQYQEQLFDGSLTQLGKTAAIDGLEEQAKAAFGNAGNQEKFIDRLEDLNQMGELSQIANISSNPVSILVTGANNAGLPLSLVCDMTGLPITDETPVRDSTNPAGKGVLYNPQSNEQTVAYTLAGQQFSMQPGEEQRLSGSQIIEFDNGYGSTKRFRLADGTYEWRVEDNGWMVRRVEVEVVLDNSQHDGDFHYLIDNQRATVAAGEVVAHRSKLPIEIAFDRGNGGQDARKLLTTGTYVVAVDAEKEQLDLFREEDVAEDLYAEVVPGAAAGHARSSMGYSSKRQRIDELLQNLKGSNARKTSASARFAKPTHFGSRGLTKADFANSSTSKIGD